MLRKLTLAASVAAISLLGASPVMAERTDIILGVALEPTHLDPTAGAAASIDEIVYANIFEGLTRIDQNGAVQPALAKSWTISDDGLVYVFTLHSDVKFHDGTSFEAGDVAFSINRAMADDSTNAQKSLFEPIASVEAVDTTTVKLTLKRPTGSLLFNLGWGDAVIVAPESADNNKTSPVGTGPFVFSKWIKGDSVQILRNDAYWGTPVKLEKATFKIISDATAAFASLMAGDVDAFANFGSPENIPQLQADPRFTVSIGSTEGETILSTNNKRPPFDNLKVRQALAHAINRQSIIDGAMFGQGTPIGTHFAPHHAAYLDLTDKYPYNPARAKELLAEAGYPDGFKATIKLPPPSYARRGGEIIASDLRKVGIDLEIIPVEWGPWIKDVFKAKDYDLTIVSHTEPMDIGIYARDDYYFQYSNQAFKDVIKTLAAEADPAKRTALMQQAQTIISDDAVNGFLFQLAKTGVWNSKLKGMWANAPVQANDLTGVYWEN